MRWPVPKLLAGAMAAPLMLLAASASAGPSAADCGNFNLATASECHFDVTTGCTANCTPLDFEAACGGQCTGTASANCNASCDTACEGSCTANPGSFSCSGACESDCDASCSASCSSESDVAGCTAYCNGSCKDDCEAQCHGVAPSADCSAQCTGACGGSCTAQANLDCSYGCSSTITGSCTADCSAPSGALFCDGQYVHIVNFDDCVAYLESTFALTINLNISSVGTIKCATAPGRAPWDVGAVTMAVMGVGLVVARRRRS